MVGVMVASETPCDVPMMSDAPCDAPVMGGVNYHCKTPLNIDIYPSTLFFFENIGHKYDF